MLKRISELVTDKWPDGLPSNRIAIEAPIGSGKSYWVINELPKLGKTLLVCSRVAIKEQAKQKANSTSFTVYTYGDTPYNADAQLTIAHAWDLAGTYDNIDSSRWDIIVIDEAHMLLADVFTSVMPNLDQWIRWKVPKETTIILMSATLSPMKESLIDEGFMYFNWNDEACKVTLNKVVISKMASATSVLQYANENYKVLYYCVSALRAHQLAKRLKDLEYRAIAITSQPWLVKDRKKRKQYKKKVEAVQNELYINEHFPDNIDIIITTSKLREGINIKDDRVRIVISELLDSVSLMQVAGRVRTGIDVLMLINNRSLQYNFSLNKDPLEIDAKVDRLNSVLEAVAFSENPHHFLSYDMIREDLENLLRYEKLNMVYYNTHSKCFEINEKWRSYQYEIISNNKDWKCSRTAYVAEKLRYPNVIDETLEGQANLKPGVEIHQQEIIDYIDKQYLGIRFTITIKNDLVKWLNLMGYPKKQLNKILHPLGYNVKRLKDKRHYFVVKDNKRSRRKI